MRRGQQETATSMGGGDSTMVDSRGADSNAAGLSEVHSSARTSADFPAGGSVVAVSFGGSLGLSSDDCCWPGSPAAAGGDPDVVVRCLKSCQSGSKSFKVHLDGYNLMPFFKGE
jgi:hypothetical protein